MKELIRRIVDNLDDEVCKYCIYEIDCPGPVTSYGNGPVFAPCADGSPENWFDLDIYMEEEREMLKIEKIIYNNPATIVWFADGEKVVVKAHNERFDREKGVAMAIARKLYSRSEFVKLVESGETQNKLDKIFKETARKDFELNQMETQPNIKARDRVQVLDNNGNSLGEGIVVTVNEFREPNMKYAIDADFYREDYLFVGKENLVKIQEED